MKKLMFGKLLINFMFVAALVLTAFQGVASAYSGGGTGTAGSPYLITNCTQLQEMNDDLAASYKLANDIDCSATTSWNAGAGFIPIMANNCNTAFTGSLDGNNHTVSNLYENLNAYCAGLFGYMSGASVSDLTLKNVNITLTDDYAGGLAGYADSGTTITNVHTTGTIDGQYYIGGLVGSFYGDSITHSSSTVNITGESNLGGLVGDASGDISQSYATGSMSGYEYIGGLIGGFNSGTISDSYALGNATGSVNGANVGGFVGYNGGTIANSYSTGTATGADTTGGFVVQNDGTVTNSFWDTQTSGQATSGGGTGKTTSAMKSIGTFTGAGWDFTTIWDINGTDNHGYPFFRWQTFPVVADGDGVSDSVENASPNNGDANNDGTPDKDQATVTSLVSPVTNKYAVLDTAGCTANNNVSIAAEDASHNDTSYSYPGGLMDFTLTCTPGATATVTMYYYSLPSTNVVLRKYNPTTHTYTTVTGATVSSVTIGGQQATKIVYQVTDGGSLDEDGTANGVIVDPAGPAVLVASVSAPNTGVLRASSLPAFMSIAFGLSLAIWTRRRTVRNGN